MKPSTISKIMRELGRRSWEARKKKPGEIQRLTKMSRKYWRKRPGSPVKPT